MKTYISDTFPLCLLECQYFDICKDYKPSKEIKGDRKRVCMYNHPCALRQWFRVVIEPYMPENNLEMQVKLILEENKGSF